MLNLTDSVTVMGKSSTEIDPDTGQPVLVDNYVLQSQPCAFAVLNAEQTQQVWGEGVTTGQSITAHLVLPTYATQLDTTDRYTVTVGGYTGTFRVSASRPGRDWTTYLLTRN